MSDPISVVVPARNEAHTIAKVVTKLTSLDWVDEVVVVDNASDDGTAEIAERAGARSVFEGKPGFGNAIRTGFGAARNDWIMKLDADLEKFDTSLFARMPAARAPGVGLVKGAWHDPKDNMPMTRLLVTPAINQMFPGLSHLRAPNSGLYLFDRSWIADQEIVGTYAADLDVMLRVYAAGADVVEVEIGQIAHDSRNIGHYNAMAEVIMAHFLEQQERRITEELVVMAEDASQVIDNCLGVLAARSRFGGPVNVYLGQPTDKATRILDAALAPFPTARILPLEQASAFTPVNSASNVRLFAPYPAAHENRAIRAALYLEDQIIQPSDVLLMPLGSDRGAVDGFRADVALEVGAGAAIKQAAMKKLLTIQHGHAAPSGPREMFQTYDSLPDPLRLSLQSRKQVGVGNM